MTVWQRIGSARAHGSALRVDVTASSVRIVIDEDAQVLFSRRQAILFLDLFETAAVYWPPQPLERDAPAR